MVVAKAMWLDTLSWGVSPRKPLGGEENTVAAERLAQQHQESWGLGQCEPWSHQDGRVAMEVLHWDPVTIKCRGVAYPVCSWGLAGTETTHHALYKRS